MTPDLFILIVFLIGLVTGWLSRSVWTDTKKRNREFDAWVRRIR